MDANKMREQFEVAFVEEQVRLCGEGFRSSALYMIEQNVVTVRMAWWAWQASREAVVVEFPKMKDQRYWESCPETEGECFVYPKYLSDVRRVVEALGLKVAP